ncbi:MAG: NUDIX hydrolase [Tepidamorphaceae bacterium]
MADILPFQARQKGVIAAASVCVFRETEVLLVKRAKPPFLWSLPGGRIEPGETPEQAAIRELMEETGVTADIIAAGQILDFTTGGGDRYVINNFAARYMSGEARAMSDAAEVAWETLCGLTRYSLTPNAREVIAHARGLLGA